VKLEEFREQYNYAPFELYEFAQQASKVKDCYYLSESADDYLRAKRKFKEALEYYEIEVG
jgi:hypothetical protein